MAITVYTFDGNEERVERRQRLARRRILVFTIGMFAVVFVPTAILVKVANDHPIQSRAERLERHCMFERVQLSQDLDDVLRGNDRAQYAFNALVGQDWREVTVCAPDGVPISAGCDPGNRSCMAGAVTAALSRITY